jgi:hypothetical protein
MRPSEPWAGVTKVIGLVGSILATFCVISWAVDVDEFWATMGVIFLGAPIVIFLATWPIALAQALGDHRRHRRRGCRRNRLAAMPPDRRSFMGITRPGTEGHRSSA